MQRVAVLVVCCFTLGFTCTKAFDISNGECLTSCDEGRANHSRWRDCSDCHSYKKCTSDGLETITCPADLIWNWRLDTPNCDLPSVGCDDCITDCEDKEKNTGRRWRHCTDCHKYHMCTTGNGLETVTCPGNLTWNWRLATPNCDMKMDVCDSLTTVCSDGCDFNVDGSLRVIPHCQCCNVFHTCFGTMGTRHSCNVNLAYSPVTKNCADESGIDCGKRIRCSAEGSP